MTIKDVCVLILIVSISFVCGIIALAAGKMIALCVGLIFGGAAILAATFTIYLTAKERSQKQAKDEQKPTKSKRSSSNARKRN